MIQKLKFTGLTLVLFGIFGSGVYVSLILTHRIMLALLPIGGNEPVSWASENPVAGVILTGLALLLWFLFFYFWSLLFFTMYGIALNRFNLQDGATAIACTLGKLPFFGTWFSKHIVRDEDLSKL